MHSFLRQLNDYKTKNNINNINNTKLNKPNKPVCLYLLKNAFEQKNNKAEDGPQDKNNKHSGQVLQFEWNRFISCHFLGFGERATVVRRSRSFFGVLHQSGLLQYHETIANQ